MDEENIPIRMGEVTSVNDTLLYFIINEDIYVNAGIYLALNRPCDMSLPKVGDKIPIPFQGLKTHLHVTNIGGKIVRMYSLCFENAPMKFTESVRQGQKYSWMIQDNNLGSEDLCTITEMYESIKDTVSLEMEAPKSILRWVESKLNRRETISDKFAIGKCCNNELVPRLKCKTISHCKHVRTDGQGYEQFPFWSFGCHWSVKEEILIGYLFVHPDLGTICIKDAKRTFGCVIMKNDGHDLDDVIGKSVYIERYFIIAEIFNPNSKFNLDYICINFNDIEIPEVSTKRKRDDNQFRKFTLKFVILSKSYPNFTQAKGLNFFLLIEEVETVYLRAMHNIQTNRCFLCFSKDFIQRWPTLEVSNVYNLRFNDKLTTLYDTEYSRIDAGLSQLYVKNQVLLSSKIYRKTEKPLQVLDEGTVDQILQRTGLISFIGTLKLRKFCRPNDSRTKQSNIPNGFGLLGDQTHILDFCVGNSQTSLTLYLNNWERLAMPIGLIPYVVVKLRDVIVQNKRYLKSSALTTLEIVDYRPLIKFTTANLFEDSDWGTVMPLELIQDVPDLVVIHTVINRFEIIKLSIRQECDKCKSISTGNSNICGVNECGGTVGVQFKFSVYLEDGKTKARIICRNLDVLKSFLAIKNDNDWRDWKLEFEKFGLYFFQRFSHLPLTLSYEHMNFIAATSYRLKRNEKKLSKNISLLLRKLANDRHFRKDETLWFGLKAKMHM